MIETKTCNTCGKEKSVDSFPEFAGRKGVVYRRNQCAECRRLECAAQRKQYYEKNKDDAKAYQAEYRQRKKQITGQKAKKNGK